MNNSFAHNGWYIGDRVMVRVRNLLPEYGHINSFNRAASTFEIERADGTHFTTEEFWMTRIGESWE